MVASTFRTRSSDLAYFLKYALPLDAHLRTATDPEREGRFTFTFKDESACKQLADEFFAGLPVVLGDLWAYNAAVRDTRRTMRFADKYGTWIRKEESN